MVLAHPDVLASASTGAILMTGRRECDQGRVAADNRRKCKDARVSINAFFCLEPESGIIAVPALGEA
jgi:hypothetical protein